jgi:phosphate starvation-inducible PhoH-like protein
MFATGYPGTGKTFLACYEGLKALNKGEIAKITVTKPCVEVGDDSLGFLPGDLEEKMAPFIRSVEECITHFITRESLDRLKDQDKFEVLPLNHLRGLTLDNTFLIADEMQNANYLQTKTLLTRIGDNSRFVLNGDLGQTDIKGGSGLPVFLKMLRSHPEVGHTDFLIDDIVRSGILKDIMIRIYEHENPNG